MTKDFNLNITNRTVYVFIAVTTALAIIGACYAAYTPSLTGHSANTIWIDVPGVGEETLQTAISLGHIKHSGMSEWLQTYDCSLDTAIPNADGSSAYCPANKVLIGGVGCGGEKCGGLTTFMCCKIRFA